MGLYERMSGERRDGDGGSGRTQKEDPFFQHDGRGAILLEERKIRRKAGAVIAERIRKQIALWTNGRLSMDVIVFSSELGVLGEAGGEE